MKLISFRAVCTALICVVAVGLSAQTVTLSVDDLQMKPGETKTVEVNMDNGDLQIGAAVIKVVVPDGLSVVENKVWNEDDEEWVTYMASLTDRKKSKFTLNENLVKVEGGNSLNIVINGMGQYFKGNSGAILTFQIKASEEVVSDIVYKLHFYELSAATVDEQGFHIDDFDAEVRVFDRLVLDDAVGFTSQVDIKGVNVSYSRVLPGDWGTLVLPFDYDVSDLSGFTFYEFSGVSEEALLFDKVIDTEIDAYTPLLFKRKSSSTQKLEIKADNVVLEADREAMVIVDDWKMIGLCMKREIVDSEELSCTYYIYGNEIRQSLSRLVLNPFRAYFTAPKGSLVSSVSTDDGEITAVRVIKADAVMGVVYDMSGRQESVPSGMYILNGSKYLSE